LKGNIKRLPPNQRPGFADSARSVYEGHVDFYDPKDWDFGGEEGGDASVSRSETRKGSVLLPKGALSTDPNAEAAAL
jgi:hypothetical protein